MRHTVTKFRLGISNIKVHKYRYSNVTDRDLMCPFCKESEENEVHFKLTCPAYYNLRLRFIEKKYYNQPCLFRFCLLMSTQNENTVRNLSMYIHKAYKLREALMS